MSESERGQVTRTAAEVKERYPGHHLRRGQERISVSGFGPGTSLAKATASPFF
jgi:hypothetical protein